MKNHKTIKLISIPLTEQELNQITRRMKRVWFDTQHNLLLIGKRVTNLPDLEFDAYYYETKTPKFFLADQNDANIVYIGEL